MSLKLIEKLRKDRDDYAATIEGFAARLEAGEELSEGDAKSLADCRTAAAELNDRIGELQEQETARLKNAMRDAEFDEMQSQAKEHATGRARTEDRPKSLGEQWVESPQFQSYLDRRSGSSDALAVQFNLISSKDAGGKPFAGVIKTAEAPMPDRSTPLLDAAMPIQVDRNDYFWEEWPVTVPSAGDVAEGAPKPEATIVPVTKNGQLGKAAHWITVTEEALEDNTGLRSRIDTELVDGVRQRAEEKAIAALVGATLPTAEGETLMKAIRVGIAKVQMAGFGGGQMSVALNPLDYADIDIELLALTLQGARANSPLWGLSIVPAGAVAAGTAYVGDIYRGMRKYFRSEAKVKMSDSHAALFLENKFVILAEQRLSVHVVRPDAIVEVSAAVIP
jgi:Phage capsid family